MKNRSGKEDSETLRKRNPKGSLRAINKPITVKLSESDFEYLSKLAKGSDSTMADSIRESVKYYIYPEMEQDRLMDLFLADLKSDGEHFKNYQVYLHNALIFCEAVAKFHEKIKEEWGRLYQIENECQMKLKKLKGGSEGSE